MAINFRSSDKIDKQYSFFYSLQSKLAKLKSAFLFKIDYSKHGLRIEIRGQVKKIQLFLDFKLIL